MDAITGITGKVGSETALHRLAGGRPVRAVMRDPAKASDWAARGCDVAIAAMDDADRLAAAFSGAECVFILPPSEFDPAPGYPEAKRVIDAVTSAMMTARPQRIVCLSTIGADAPHDNLLTQRSMLEQALGEIGIPVTFLRPAWFMDNARWDIPAAQGEGVFRSFLQPADKVFPMVATRDVGRVAAELMGQDWIGTRIVELEGPGRYSPGDVALALATALGRPVRLEIVPRQSWEKLFRAQGARNPGPRMRMLDGFNEGWIEFGGNGDGAVNGDTPLASVIKDLVTAAGRATA